MKLNLDRQKLNLISHFLSSSHICPLNTIMCISGFNSNYGDNEKSPSLLNLKGSRYKSHLVINVGVRSDKRSIDDLTIRHGHNDQLPDIRRTAPQTVVTLEDTKRSS